MERQFYLNWQVLIEEAKQRRKKQKLTQQQLAHFAKVSAPTISRFENGEKNIQLSSILNILGVLGMVDQRRLDFPKDSAQYIFDRGVVRFIGQDGDREVICEISREVLSDDFYYDGQYSLKTGVQHSLDAFTEHKLAIEHEARRKYIAGKIETDGIVLIKSEDL